MTGILTKTGVAPSKIDYVLMGTVIQEAKNQNIARDAGLAAGIPNGVPSHTVTQACISSNQVRARELEHLQQNTTHASTAAAAAPAHVHAACVF
jgi:acetyl-CoA acetyltransferase